MENEQVNVVQKLTNEEITAFVTKLLEEGKSKDICNRVKYDLEYGYSKEMVDLYLQTGWNIDKIRAFSEVIGKTGDKDFIEFIRSSQFGERQIKALLSYHLKGIPLEDMIAITGQDLSEYAMDAALNKLGVIYENAKNALADTQAVPIEDEHVKELLGQISERVGGIENNKELMEKILKRLDTLDHIQESGDEVKDSLANKVESLEKQLSDQQSRVNRSVTELAEKNGRISALAAEKESLEEKCNSMKEEIDSARKEKMEMERKMDGLVEEIATLQKQLEKERDETKKQKEKMQISMSQKESISEVGNGKPLASSTGMPEQYQAQAITANGTRQMVQVERTARRSSDGLLALAGKKLFRNKTSLNLISHLKNASLNQAQMHQVKVAIESGLSEEEVVDIINSGFAAEEMAQAIEIVLAEKRYN